METKLIRLLSKDQNVRIFLIDNTAMANTLAENIPINQVGKEAFIKTFTISSLLCGLMEGRQRLTVQMTCSAPSHTIHCEIDASGKVNGYCSKEFLKHNPDNIKDLIGNRGYIRITKAGDMGSMYTGCVDMPFQNIIDDFSHYFRQSEQLHTSFRCFYNCTSTNTVLLSRGCLIQLMPFAEPEQLKKWEQFVDHHQENIKQLPMDQIVETLFSDTLLMEKQPIRRTCECSREMFYGMISSLGTQELKHIINTKQTVELSCGICGSTYSFHYNDIKPLVENGGLNLCQTIS